MRRPSRRVARPLLALASALVSWGAVEASLRAARLVPEERRPMETRPFPPLRVGPGLPRYEYRPGTYHQVFFRCRGGDCARDKRVRFDVNSEGLRDRERPRGRPAGVRRVLCLGDSFTVGFGVRLSDSWPKQLESLLNDRGGRRYDVVNAAVSMLGTLDEWHQLKNRGARFRPDVVVVGFYLNDAFPTWTGPEKPAFAAALDPDPAVSNLLSAARYPQGLITLRWLAAARLALRSRFYTRDWYRRLWDERYNPVGLAQVDEALDAFARYQKDTGTPVFFVLFPKLEWLDGDYPFADIHERMIASCRRRGLGVVDLLPRLRGRPSASLWQHPTDHHPNPEVHREAASAVLGLVLKRGLL